MAKVEGSYLFYVHYLQDKTNPYTFKQTIVLIVTKEETIAPVGINITAPFEVWYQQVKKNFPYWADLPPVSEDELQ